MAFGFPQADPFDAVNSFPGNGQILIGQFSTTNGTAISGSFLIQYTSNGVPGQQSAVSFFHVPSPGALAMMGAAGLIGTRRRRTVASTGRSRTALTWGNDIFRQQR